jgi:hypothetical protein
MESTPCEDGSNPFFLPLRDGLLRGACHRAALRATRWLAMTADADISFQIQEYATIPGFPNPLYMINII